MYDSLVNSCSVYFSTQTHLKKMVTFKLCSVITNSACFPPIQTVAEFTSENMIKKSFTSKCLPSLPVAV